MTLNLDELTGLLDPGSPPDPLDGLLDLAKTLAPDPGGVELPLTDLQVDPDYQRPPDREKIAALVKHLEHGGVVQPIKVNRRPDGSHWITDGQHRAAAAAIVGRSSIRCDVTAVAQRDEPQETNIVTKIAAERERDTLTLLFGAGARRDGKRLVLDLGSAGNVTYMPHGGEWIAKTERGRLHVDAPDAGRVLARLGLDAFSESPGLPPEDSSTPA